MHVDTNTLIAFFIGALFAAPAYLLVGLVAGAIFSGRIRRGDPVVSMPSILGGKSNDKTIKKPDKRQKLGYYNFDGEPQIPAEATPEQITEELRKSRSR